MPDIFGNTSGLSAQSRKTLERIYRRRVPLQVLTTPELVRSLCDATRETKRQVGALVHRSGRVEWVIVGTASGLMLPDIGRLRAAEGRFRGLRLIHTHLYGEPLTHDDLVDLTRLRLDMVAAILCTPSFEARSFTWAHCIPKSPASSRASAVPKNEMSTLPGASSVSAPNEARPGDATALPYEIYPPAPWGRPLPNFEHLIRSLEDEFAKRSKSRQVAKQRAILVHVGDKRKAGAGARARSSMRELESLALTAGVSCADSIIQLRDRIDPKLVMGRGKLENVVMRAIDLDAEILIFDQELSPSQASGIAAHTDLQVIDRSQLILDIFAQRAETKDGKLQVELAQLKYRIPLLGQKDDALSRLTGGIGGRGPGETKLEVGRRRADERVTRLEKELKNLAKQRHVRRRRRATGTNPILAIVGYTNAGKSTLLNTLTGAGVLAEDKLFATLDTRSRRLFLPSGKTAIVSDTVGFIRKMPKDLFAAFKATFEEAADADLIIEVLDSSDPEQDEHLETTDALLNKLGLGHIPRLRIKNKMDLLSNEEKAVVERDEGCIGLSATDKSTLRDFLLSVDSMLGHEPEPEPLAESGIGVESDAAESAVSVGSSGTNQAVGPDSAVNEER